MHLAVLKDFFSTPKALNKGQSLSVGEVLYNVPKLLSASDLDNQWDLLKLTMKSNAEATCGPPFNVNLVVKLWRKLSQSRHLFKLISEYFKMAEIGCCLVLGLVEDERCFSNLKFLESCLRND